MNNIYKKYKERLVEISGKNRSLFAKKIGKQYAYDIGKILKKDTENTSLFLEFLMQGKRTGFTLISKESRPYLFDALNLNDKLEKKFADKSKMNTNEARTETLRRERLKKEELKKANIAQVNNLRILKREVEEFAKETGRYEMFVGYPFVQGELNRDTMIKGPLILFPMTINIRDEFTVDLEFKKDEPVQLNKVFILAYAKQNKLVIDDLIQEFDSNNRFNFQSIKEVIDYLNKFGFKLKYTEKATLEDFEEGGEPRRGDKLTIKNYAVVGRFPLANSIYNDYVTLEKSKLSTPAIDMLLSNKEMEKSKIVDTKSYPITESDYAQQLSLEEINHSGNVVVFGPPGTGKSQSIVNIISDSIAKGKRVLVVSQKKVAMDVVFNRLGTLSNRTMYITDVDKSATMFYDKVKRAHNEVMSDFSNDALAKHNKINKDIEAEVAHLQELSNALFEPLEYGVSLQTLYSTTPQIKKDTKEYDIYKKLIENKDLMNFNYSTLKDITTKIYDKKIDKLFYKYNHLVYENLFIPFLKLDINIEDLHNTQTYINKILSKESKPFDFGQYLALKPILFANLHNDQISDKNIDKFVKLLIKIDNNKYSRKEIIDKKEKLKLDYSTLLSKANEYIGEEELLKKVLTKEGYSIIVDNILSGSNTSIRLLSDALKNYANIKDLRQNLQILTDNERLILQFAQENSSSEEDIHNVIHELLHLRNYHEIVKAEEKEDKKLSFILDYENTKTRIINLKNELLEINKDIAYVSFNKNYTDYYNSRKDNKDYLYVINKQENMWNIRKTMEYFSEYMLRLFPCWMMSPENVSSIMPLKQELFDVVVFDEASQIFIENSIPTIYRGKSVAIAGDRKQLRPTTTFMKRYIGNENFDELSLTEQAALEVESLLDLATSRFSNANLTYHYRSKYEELINFSNYAFYDEKLAIAPNNCKNAYKPIERIKVNGKWQDRRNHEEALEVVKTIKKIFQTRTNNETIGVITFNTEQEHYIEDIIDIECQKDPAFREIYLKEASRRENGEDTGIFIKNIENVQGEERDIIIFSVGYAKNERGKVVAQFGPLSMEGGENRLNVAITRAKEKIYLITSIEPEDLNVAYSKNVGPKILKKYLQYARAVSFDNKYEQKIILESLRKKTIIEESTTAGLEEEIKKELTKKKYIVDTNIGNAKYKINLAIYNKKLDRYVLGIEIDSNAYTSSESLLERDVYRTKFLNSRGWNMMRLWSRDWWTDKNQAIELIIDKINKATEKVTKEIAEAKKNKTKKKAIISIQEENPLAQNVFEKTTTDKPIISTRLSKKILSRLEEEKEKESEINEEIKKINENPEYNLVLENIEENPVAEKKKQKTTETTNTKYLDDVEEKFEGKKDKIAEKQKEKAKRRAEKQEKKNKLKKEKEALRNQKLKEKEEKRQEKLAKKEEARQNKKYNKKSISKAKSQLDSLNKLKSIKQPNTTPKDTEKKLSIEKKPRQKKTEKVPTVPQPPKKRKSKSSDTLARIEALKNKRESEIETKKQIQASSAEKSKNLQSLLNRIQNKDK